MHRQRGSIYQQMVKRPDGTVWKAQSWTLRFYVDGRARKETVKGSKKEAMAVLTERLQALQRGTYVAQKRSTFKDYVTAWLTGRQIKPSTRASYASVLGLESKAPRPHQLLTVFGERSVHSITTAEINQWVTAARTTLSVKSVRNGLTLLTTLFEDAVAEGFCAVNPLKSRALARPKVLTEADEPEEIDVLDPAELIQLLDAAAPATMPLLMTASYTGMRQGELLGLQWGDIDWTRHQVHVRRSVHKGIFYVPKSRRSKRAIHVGDQLLAVLSGLRRERYEETPPPADALIFANEQGRPLDADNWRKRVWEPTLATAKLRAVRFHSLRHTFASMLIAQGENIKYVSSQLGHASIQITVDRYGHLFKDEKRTAATRMEAALAELRAPVADVEVDA